MTVIADYMVDFVYDEATGELMASSYEHPKASPITETADAWAMNWFSFNPWATSICPVAGLSSIGEEGVIFIPGVQPEDLPPDGSLTVRAFIHWWFTTIETLLDSVTSVVDVKLTYKHGGFTLVLSPYPEEVSTPKRVRRNKQNNE